MCNRYFKSAFQWYFQSKYHLLKKQKITIVLKFDYLIDQICKIVTLPLKDYIEYKLNNSTEKLEFGLSDACEVAFKEIQNGKYKDQFKDGFKAIKNFGNSWCFIPEYKDQNESEPIVRNLMVLIVSKNNLKFDWADHMYIIKDLKNSNEIEIPDAYKINWKVGVHYDE